MNQYLLQLSQLAIDAGEQIMKIYAQDFDIYTKQDASPVTQADRIAEDIIIAGLKKLTPNIPIIAEEMASENALPKLSALTEEAFYLVDPLDGTKEFIHKRDEFTVNIALIEHHQPRIGIIFAPVLNVLYVGDVENKLALKIILNDQNDLSNPLEKIDISDIHLAAETYKILASRSHINPQTEAYIAQISAQYDKVEIVNIGSSLKLCLLGAGEADIYPRFGPTMEWDIAAGHAILNAGNGHICDENGHDFTYGNQDADFRNGNFIAYASKQDYLRCSLK